MHDLSVGKRRPSTVERWAPSVYFLIGQLGWFARVLSAARDVPCHGSAWQQPIVLVAVHLARVERPSQEFKLLVSVVDGGDLGERAGCHRVAHVPERHRFASLPGIESYRILSLRALFATQFNTRFGWLKQRMLLASELGAIAGPMSFRAGAALGASIARDARAGYRLGDPDAGADPAVAAMGRGSLITAEGQIPLRFHLRLLVSTTRKPCACCPSIALSIPWLTMLDYADGLITSPERRVVPLRDGAVMLSMPAAAAADLAMHKLVNVCPKNGALGLPTIHAHVFKLE